MKSRLIIRCIIAAVAVIAFQGCGDETTQPQPHREKTLEELIAGTPRANEEAEVAALWLSQELIVSDSLYDEMVQKLQTLRQSYGPEIPALNAIGFWHGWSERIIGVYLYAEARSRFVHGEFHDADSLNAFFRGTINYSDSDTNDEWFTVVYRFAVRLNLDSIASYYGLLAGVKSTQAYWVFRSDGSNLYPGRDPQGRLTFLLRKAWGDCPAGCIYSHFWYFKFDGDSVALIGDFLTDYVHDPPEWWNEASASYFRFRHFQTGIGPRENHGSAVTLQ